MRFTLLPLLALACAPKPAGPPPAAVPTSPLTCDLPDAPALVVPDQDWRAIGRETLAARQAVQRIDGPAKNVIFFLADGMDPTTIAAARIHEGQTRGMSGEENLLSFETFPHLGMSKTYTVDHQTPDSAGTMSAMMTGVKTRSGVISISADAPRGDCEAGIAAAVPTLLELAEDRGLATGTVSTARLTHATPAATYAHAADRHWENDRDLPEGAEGCTDIARQLVDFDHGDGLEVALGGGRANFLPITAADPEYPDQTGARGDGADLTAAWQARGADRVYVWNAEQLAALDPADAPKVLGLFEPSDQRFEHERRQRPDLDPSLAEQTAKAIDLLSAHEQGYLLVVEGGRVDHAHHGGLAHLALSETVAFADAVRVAREKTDRSDTLVLVTADHGHTMTFAGYPHRGNPILGLATTLDGDDVAIAVQPDGKPYTTLQYANGPGAGIGGLHPGGRQDPACVDTTDPRYRQAALVPNAYETHGGQDVTIYADGPGAWWIDGVMEQHVLFYVVEAALQLR